MHAGNMGESTKMIEIRDLSEIIFIMMMSVLQVCEVFDTDSTGN